MCVFLLMVPLRKIASLPLWCFHSTVHGQHAHSTASLFYTLGPLFTCFQAPRAGLGSRGCCWPGRGEVLLPDRPAWPPAAPGRSLSGPRRPGTSCCVNCHFKRINGSFKMAGIPFNKLPTFQKINYKIKLLPGYLLSLTLCSLPLRASAPCSAPAPHMVTWAPLPPGLCWSLIPHLSQTKNPLGRGFTMLLSSARTTGHSQHDRQAHHPSPPQTSHPEGMAKVTCKEIHSPCHPNSRQDWNNTRAL